ncbi:acyltransferase family protein [Tsukamurella soli]|uniref:Acyltransferase n=1 Tax=Tsukamurella soli TaxID=644556 RepID=A0ABP8JEU5_9ACTN
MRSVPPPASVAGTVPARDRAIDVARLGSLLVVMFGHCALLLATIDGGGVEVGNILGALPALQPLTWALQVMPMFFLVGGAVGVYALPAGGSSAAWGTWLLHRAQRLCRPTLWYLAIWSAVILVTRVVAGSESARALGAESVALLWFLGVYLVVLAFVPLLCRMRSAAQVAVVVGGLLAIAAAVDAVRLTTGSDTAGAGNFVAVWLIPTAIGVAYARRLLTVRTAVAVAVAAFAAQVVLAMFGPYDLSLVVTGADRVSNTSPPTVLLGLHCLWMSLAFVAVAAPVRRWAARPRVWHVTTVGNGGAMTLYLWHIPAIAVTALALHTAGLDAYDVHARGFWIRLALRCVVFAVVVAAAFLLLSPLEHRRLPWLDSQVVASGSRGVAAGTLVCLAGIALVVLSRYGLGSGPGWEALGAFAVALAGARAIAQRKRDTA